ncbi:hypothetical protein [Streptomyces chartreusis]|uniref:hypothetical protein n=1 Tax=Streptomyces chartreusis TaxID=1969 RepID=UPI00380458B9
MDLIEEQYLGWEQLAHTADCPAPTWDVAEWLYDTGARRVADALDQHACVSSDCDHHTTFNRLRLRLLCRDCDTVHTMSGESYGMGCTTTASTGWGQPPRQVGGVWLWPGQPARPGGDPHAYLVTLDRVDQVTAANLYGLITKYRDADGTARWIAGAVRDDQGAHYVSSLRWRHRSAGLADLDAAAEWIATVDTAPQRPLEVAV